MGKRRGKEKERHRRTGQRKIKGEFRIIGKETSHPVAILINQKKKSPGEGSGRKGEEGKRQTDPHPHLPIEGEEAKNRDLGGKGGKKKKKKKMLLPALRGRKNFKGGREGKKKKKKKRSRLVFESNACMNCQEGKADGRRGGGEKRGERKATIALHSRRGKKQSPGFGSQIRVESKKKKKKEDDARPGFFAVFTWEKKK